MNPPRNETELVVRFPRDFYWRHGLVGGLLLLFSLALMPALGPLGPMRFLAPLVFLGPWLAIVLRAHGLAVRLIDGEGVTRHDGKRYLWTDLVRTEEVNMWRHDRPVGPLNHVDIVFVSGRARVLPRIMENGWEAIRLAREREVALAAPVVPDRAVRDSGPGLAGPCVICGELKPYHRGIQKHGREAEDTFLPPAASKLKSVKESRPGQSNSPTLKKCPGCGSWFYYKETYEYYADGGEDDQELRRLTPGEAESFLRGEKLDD